MNFEAKFLRKNAAEESNVVYVLMDIDENNESSPVGVVTSEQQANRFMGQDNKNRNWFRFNLNELPENIQPISGPTEEEQRNREQLEEIAKHRKYIEQSGKQINQMNQGIQRMMRKRRV